MLGEIDLSKLTNKQLQDLKAKLRIIKPVARYKSLVKDICDLPPEKSKEILCKMAQDVQEKSIEGGWQKIVLNSIKSHM
jgi:hypothetical protein